MPCLLRPAGGKKGSAKREAGDKPAAKGPKKAKKTPPPVEAAPAGDVEMAEAAGEPAVVGSGRQAAQVRPLAASAPAVWNQGWAGMPPNG